MARHVARTVRGEKAQVWNAAMKEQQQNGFSINGL